MNSSKLLLQATFLFLLVNLTSTQEHRSTNSTVTDNAWESLNRMVGFFVDNCRSGLKNERQQQQGIFQILQTCFKQKTLKLLTKIFQEDVIEIWDGIEFVRDRNGIFNRKMENNTEQQATDWNSRITDAVIDVFETHTLKIRLVNLVKQDGDVNEARRRHHHKHDNSMVSFMMFGVVSMGMLLIPMGFKFLTVLGAKALLLAKMALILTSIQGLKKVATSGINYGLYHSPSEHDRFGLENIPDEQLDFVRHNFVRS